MRYVVESYWAADGISSRFRVVDTHRSKNGGKRVVMYTRFTTIESANHCAEQLNTGEARIDVAAPAISAALLPVSPVGFGPESITTPNAAKVAAAIVSAACFNDEIRAHVAQQLLARILTPADDAVARAYFAARDASTKLATAYDRQFRD
jgi:hypothetical protein